VTAASPRIPLPLTEELVEVGKIVLPLGESFSQVLTVAEKKSGALQQSSVCGCVFVPLVGKYGFHE
jgi:protein-L-isoaspartate(D-aspartate) O-methyltransferase